MTERRLLRNPSSNVGDPWDRHQSNTVYLPYPDLVKTPRTFLAENTFSTTWRILKKVARPLAKHLLRATTREFLTTSTRHMQDITNCELCKLSGPGFHVLQEKFLLQQVNTFPKDSFTKSCKHTLGAANWLQYAKRRAGSEANCTTLELLVW